MQCNACVSASVLAVCVCEFVSVCGRSPASVEMCALVFFEGSLVRGWFNCKHLLFVLYVYVVFVRGF